MTKNIDSFEKIAKFYSEEFEEESPFNSYYERPAMMELVKNVQNKCILDAGCGGGWYSEKLLEKGAKVVSLDINEKMVEITKKRIIDKKLDSHSKVLCHDLNEKLPTKNNTFDIIISSLAIHYLNNLKNTFKEFHRVLKPNGTLVFSTHHPFMYYKQYSTSYFDHEIRSQKWVKGKENPISVKIKYNHRTFETIVNSTSKLFKIEKIIEPKPTKEFKHQDEINYDYLNKHPHFLIIKGKKE